MSALAPFTLDDYFKLPDEPRVELILGEFRMSPAPNTRHQISLGNLFYLLKAWVDQHRLGVVMVAPTDVVLSKRNVVQPDILFVSKERSDIISEKNIKGIPDLVVEVLSPGHMARDLRSKKKLYERFGAKEYWLVDSRTETLTRYILSSEGQFHPEGEYAPGDTLQSPLFPGLKLPVTRIFRSQPFR